MSETQTVNPKAVGLAVQQGMMDLPDELARALAVAGRAVAEQALLQPHVRRGLVSAELVKPGLVITDELKAAELADVARDIIEGEKALDASVKRILLIPGAMEEAVREAVRSDKQRLAAAKLVWNDARVAWQREQRRRAAVAEAEARKKAEEAAAAAQAEAILSGEDAPPPPEVAPVEVPRTVVAGSAKSGTQVRVEAKEIVDKDAVPVEWLSVVRAIAEGFFRTAELTGKVRRAAPGESVVFMGVRFESVERAVNR